MRITAASLSDAEMKQLAETLGQRGYPGGTEGLATAARDWIEDSLCEDCRWADLENTEDIEDLSDAQVLSVIARNYEDGLDAFITSCGYPPGSRF